MTSTLRLSQIAGVLYLEGQVLEEVCCAIRGLGFGPATSVDKDADGRGLRVGRVFRRNLGTG